MASTDGQDAIITRILSMATTANFSVPDGPKGVALPRYRISDGGNPAIPRTIDGRVQAFPEVRVMVETEEGKGGEQSKQMVQDLIDLFPQGERFDGVQILVPPDPRAPLQANGVYAVPVFIRGRQFYDT